MTELHKLPYDPKAHREVTDEMDKFIEKYISKLGPLATGTILLSSAIGILRGCGEDVYTITNHVDLTYMALAAFDEQNKDTLQ